MAAAAAAVPTARASPGSRSSAAAPSAATAAGAVSGTAAAPGALSGPGDVEAVVVSRQELERLDREIGELRERVQKLTGDAPSVDRLREQFLERLAMRDEPEFGGRLRTAARMPVDLKGRLKVGDRF